MIKRRYYRAEHAERDGASSSSSSSSDDDSDVEAQLSDHHDVHHPPLHPSISSSGYESEDSSGNEIDADTSGLITKDDDSESESDKDQLNMISSTRKKNNLTVKTKQEEQMTKQEVLPVDGNIPNCVLKSKSVFKCRLCPKIVCLNEESLTTHLKSKRHVRSEKLLNDGRLKRFLNSDGEEEEVTDDEDGETHAERHARILALAQDSSTKKSRGRQRQRQRLKKKKKDTSEVSSSAKLRDNRAKRRKKNVN
ncbi:uncharacterized protein LOC141610401 [Silene latifolia]|uniref:uncharacterized protein LOC141610401 n=1 Tax=Silene latifolia TaxID=37657 RepID=UPI003D77B21F